MEAIQPILDILTWLFDCTSKSANRINDLRANQEALRKALHDLNDVRADVTTKVKLEEETQMVRTQQVSSWLEKVEDTNKSVTDILDKADQMLQRSCCFGCPQPNACWSGYKLGQEVKTKLKTMDDLKNARNSFHTVAEALPCGVADKRPMEDTVGLNSLFEQVKEWIKDSQVMVIGIHGMGGVGKTTLLKKINNHFVETNYGFDQVIWVVVSRPSTIGKVQDAICKQLKLPKDTWKDESEEDKAVKIFRILDTKKFILMLDDVWERVDLVKVGVPPISDSPKKLKVIITTRNERVCDSMRSDKKIKVQCLKKQEALNLFKKNVGTSTLNAHPNIPKLSESVVEECKGLPLALVTVGRAMAGKKDPGDWDWAIDKLRRDPSEIKDVEEELFHILKFSYDSLADDTIRSCFSHCCIYPEDHHIYVNDLLNLWIGEEFIGKSEDVHKARKQGREIIKVLKAANLLETIEYSGYVKMHDVIRDMALWISSKAGVNRYLVLDHDELLEENLVNSRVEAERVALWNINNIRSDTQVPSWSKTETLMVNSTQIKRFPSGFLQFMLKLKVLDFSKNRHLKELPSSISVLVDLEFLNLSYTNITELPVELKDLTKMKYLLLDYTSKMEIILRQVMSNYSLLRVFRYFIAINYVTWSEDVEHNNILSGGQTKLLELLEGLQHINDVSIRLYDTSSFEKLKKSPKILNCLSSLALHHFTSLEFPASSVKKMRHLQSLFISSCQMQQLIIDQFDVEHGVGVCQTPIHSMPRGTCFHNLTEVQISHCNKLLDLTWLSYAPMLEQLGVHYCSSMVEIVKVDDPSNIAGVEEVDSTMFSRLAFLHLVKLDCLESVYPCPLPFPSLVKVYVAGCPRLRRLPFDSRNARSGNLKTITGSRKWWGALEWEDETLEPLFRPYCKEL